MASRIALVFAVLLVHPLAARAVDITACETTIESHQTGVVQTDLECSTLQSQFVVRLRPHATLDLNGHSLKGGNQTAAVVIGVGRKDDEDLYESERGNFTILGPGEISGVKTSPNNTLNTPGCVVLNNGKVTITSATGVVDIHHCNFGVVGYLPGYATSKASAKIDHTVLHDNLFEGVTVRRLEVSDVTAYANGGTGIHSIGTLKATNASSYDNSVGLYAVSKIIGSNISATGNYGGVNSPGTIKIVNLVASNSTGSYGVQARRLLLVDSTVTGNALGDIATKLFPVLVNTTCGTSVGPDQTMSWGVCAND